jgi:hypothetical protein
MAKRFTRLGCALLFGALAAVVACNSGGASDCSNGTCLCPAGTSCELGCAAPPCHVDCGNGSACTGTCANGTCTCEEGAECEFSCGAPPCHVACTGSNPTCDGVCANGDCSCGPNSVCHFACQSGPCHTTCEAGSVCVVDCPPGTAGTQDCDMPTCAAGQAITCPTHDHVVCGTSTCPTD